MNEKPLKYLPLVLLCVFFHLKVVMVDIKKSDPMHQITACWARSTHSLYIVGLMVAITVSQHRKVNLYKRLGGVFVFVFVTQLHRSCVRSIDGWQGNIVMSKGRRGWVRHLYKQCLLELNCGAVHDFARARDCYVETQLCPALSYPMLCKMVICFFRLSQTLWDSIWHAGLFCSILRLGDNWMSQMVPLSGSSQEADR